MTRWFSFTSYNSSMGRDINEIFRDALALPPETRADLADTLLASLEPEIDAGWEDARREEIRKRRAELDSKSVAAIPWTEVRSQLISAIRTGNSVSKK